MIVMNIKLNNFLSFRNFEMNFSYPRRISNSYIEEEYLKDRPNFRYKKVVVLMGSNASGKTSLGQMLNRIFQFMMRKSVDVLISSVCDRQAEASFSMDFIPDNAGLELFRFETVIKPLSGKDEPELFSRLWRVKINKADNYERAASRFPKNKEITGDYLSVMREVPRFGYFFTYPIDVSPSTVPEDNSGIYKGVLEKVLCTLDPSIKKVDVVKEAKNSYNIYMMTGQNILIQEGQTVDTYLLSSGTKTGIAIADILTAMKVGKYGFYYCDERFSYIQSDLEKKVLSLMVELLGTNKQLIFTTHNTDILDMSLPQHSYMFLRKKMIEAKPEIVSMNATEYLSSSSSSLRHAVENDLFSFMPNTALLDEIINL